jgi:hypothetical protein
MSKGYICNMKNLFISLICSLFVFEATAQVPGKQVYDTINISPQGYPYGITPIWQYLPPDYSTKKFPLVIYCGGAGDWVSPTAMIQNGPGKLIADSAWLPEFILLSPKGDGGVGYTEPQNINALIDWAEKNLKVDTNRIYLTGISFGGKSCYDYVATSPYYASRIAAMIPMSAANGSSLLGLANACKAGIPVWDFCANNDPMGFYIANEQYVSAINACSPGLAQLTTINSNSHGPWLPIYGSPGVWIWLLQFAKGGAAIPVSAIIHDTLYVPRLLVQIDTIYKPFTFTMQDGKNILQVTDSAGKFFVH